MAGGSENIDRINHTIWSIDDKRKLFDINSKYSHDGSHREECSYKCDFNINEKGVIQIKNIEVEENGYQCRPNYQEGTYIFENGQYVLQED